MSVATTNLSKTSGATTTNLSKSSSISNASYIILHNGDYLLTHDFGRIIINSTTAVINRLYKRASVSTINLSKA